MCSGWNINWEALSTIATFLAILVALYPIYEGWKKEKATAINLRHRLLLNLMILRPTIARRYMDTDIGTRTSEPLQPAEYEPVNAIQALLPQTTILDPEESDSIQLVFTNVRLLRSVIKIEAQSAKNIFNLIVSTISILEKRKWNRGSLPPNPWDKKKE